MVGASSCEEAAQQAAEDAETLETQPAKIRIIAPSGKCWSGAIGSATREGCGTRTYTITDEPVVVANTQKTTDGKWPLKIELRIDGGLVDSGVTRAQYGVVQVAEG
jgi:hypothetical protein